MSFEKLRPSFTFTEDRLRELQAVVPEAFADGRINWDTLRETLGEHLEEEGEEHFGLTWPGKREARRLASIPSKGMLVPQPDEGVNHWQTRNVFIEGDNLELLKLLQKSYAGRIKAIYIDPPYNTGNDFIYPDDYSEPLEAYLKSLGQLDDEGRPLTTNSRSDGRFHSKWLNMMYPRLKLARSLLENNGIIFISIDDNEFSNLIQIMNEIFGNENLLGTFVWQSKKGGGSDSSKVVSDHEYVTCYGKVSSEKSLAKKILEAEPLDKVDQKGPYRLGRELNKWGAGSRREDRPTMFFPIKGPDGVEVYPIRNDGSEGRWRWGKKKMYQIIEKGDVEFTPRGDGTFIVYEKIRSTDPRAKPFRTWLTDVGITADGSKVVRELFDGISLFDYAKPISLLKHLFLLATPDQEGIILDFFAGSASSAQAILELNREDEGNRRFILVQLPERIKNDSTAFKAGYHTVSGISKERIRRVIKMLKNTPEGQEDQNNSEEDLGFKAFRLERSNFKEWQLLTTTDPVQLGIEFAQFESPLVEGWDEDALMTEVLLLQGFPMDSEVVNILCGATEADPQLTRIESEFCAHKLFAYLKNDIPDAVFEVLKEWIEPEDIFVCLDSAITDEVKLRLSDRCNLRVI